MHRVYHFGLGVDDNGNVQMIDNCRDTNRTQNFTYGSLNRLSTAFSSGTGATSWGNDYGEDAWGNLSNMNPHAGKTLYQSLAAPANWKNQLTGMSYDAAGNMTNDGLGNPYTYDAENRLSGTAGWTYSYDGDGQRVKKCSSCSTATGGTLYWRGSGSETLLETNLGGTVQNEYIFFNGRRVAKRDGSNVVSYYMTDHLGTTSVVTGSSGVIKDESDYYPYGFEMPIVNTLPQNYKFTGKERDNESGLDYFGARYYQSGMGRWMSADWSAKPEAVPYSILTDPQSLNLYSYVRNNPLSRNDPDGHEDDKDKDKKLPAPDAQHNHTIVVREVQGQGGNPVGHVTVQVDGGKEVGFGPKQDMTKKELIENKSVPGQIEPRAPGVKTLDSVTINVTADQAKAANATIADRTTNPGNYQLVGNSCVTFGEQVIRSAGAPVQNATMPSKLVENVRNQQYHDNTTQTPTQP